MNVNDFIAAESGWIWFITGTMFAGKTTFLMKKIKELEEKKIKVLVFKPKKDNRFNQVNYIVTHDKKKQAATILKDADQLEKIAKENPDVQYWAFDEIHFLNSKFFSIIKELAESGKKIFCAGLKKDYWNEYTSGANKLLAAADRITFLYAKCQVCGSKIATRTQRMNNGKPVAYWKPRILVGGASSYQARCNKCIVIFTK